MEKRTLPAIYILDRHLYIIDVYFPYGRPAVHYIKRCTNAYLARIFIYIAKSSSSLADQIGIRSKRVVYLTVPVSTAEKYIAHLLSTIVLYPLLFFAAIVVAQYASELISSTIRGEMFNPGTPLQGCFSMWKTVGLPRYSLLPPYLAQSRHSHSAPHCGRRTAS